MTKLRQLQLESVQQAREGRIDTRRAYLGDGTETWGEHVLRIPERDYYALLKIFPHLNSRNAGEQKAEWERFFRSDFALAYRVARTPVQVQRAPRRFPT